MKGGRRTVVELLYKKEDRLLSRYMDEAVREVLDDLPDAFDYRLVDIGSEEGKKRFLELSVNLYDEEMVYKKLRVAPLPAVFINGTLTFDQIPSRPRVSEVFGRYIYRNHLKQIPHEER